MKGEQAHYLVSDEEAGRRVDLFLSEKEPDRSRSYFQKLIEEGRVTVGGQAVKSRRILLAGETVDVLHPVHPDFPAGEERALDILYEDESLMAVNKPAGLVVHPQDAEEKGTLVHALLGLRPEIAQAVYDREVPISRLRPGIVHRLDKDTSGVIVVAKTAAALRALAGQFRDHTVLKEYLALVYGQIDEELTVHTNIRRKPTGRMGVADLTEDGREAVTHLAPQRHFFWPPARESVTLVRCRIETGRTHQIRVHCKYQGHPVLGDEAYGNRRSQALSRRLGIGRQMLHAGRLTLTHPLTGERLTFTAPPPADMQAAISRLESDQSL